MRIKILLTASVMFFIGCLSESDPGEMIINVTKTSNGIVENFSVKVSEKTWYKSRGVWTSIDDRTKPADKEAVEAIEAYMNK